MYMSNLDKIVYPIITGILCLGVGFTVYGHLYISSFGLVELVSSLSVTFQTVSITWFSYEKLYKPKSSAISEKIGGLILILSICSVIVSMCQGMLIRSLFPFGLLEFAYCFSVAHIVIFSFYVVCEDKLYKESNY